MPDSAEKSQSELSHWENHLPMAGLPFLLWRLPRVAKRKVINAAAKECENSSAPPTMEALLSVREELSLGRMRVAAMTVGVLDSTVHSVDHELGSLVLADFATCVNGLLFRFEVTAGALRAASLYIPTTVRVGNNVMSRSRHCLYPL